MTAPPLHDDPLAELELDLDLGLEAAPDPADGPPRCQCRCLGMWDAVRQLLSCGCPPCPNPPEGDDRQCLRCRTWCTARRRTVHHRSAEGEEPDIPFCAGYEQTAAWYLERDRLREMAERLAGARDGFGGCWSC